MDAPVGSERGLRSVLARRFGEPSSPLERYLKEIRSLSPGVDLKRLEKAWRYASDQHDGQLRKSGEAFINHPMEVTRLLAELRMDTATLEAAMLHDVVEDTPSTLDDIKERFGDDVAFLIDGVTKIDALSLHSREAQQAETLRKMMLATAKDLRVLLIKLCDRLHNLRTIHPLPREKQVRKATETLEVYAPLAHRLGIHRIKWELEDLSFKTLHPQEFRELERMVSERQPEREAVVEEIISTLASSLDAAKIKAQITGRPKHLWSIYQKMRARDREFGDIYDLVGVRVIVEDIRDCYATLGIAHQIWKPVPGRFKDYVAMPKLNGYRSLHTVVSGPRGRSIEVQIRDDEMHQLAEYGVAAHWRYKGQRADASEEELDWVRQILEWQRDADEPEEFLEALRVDLYTDEVFVFTPKGAVMSFPQGATPVDFAYQIHTDVGHKCVGARINGRLAPLSAELRSGDTVEILTSKSPGAGPSRDWLASVKTNRARQKIRHWFTRERREESVERGRDELIRALRRSGLPIQATLSSDALSALVREMGHPNLAALEIAIGDGHVQAATIVQRLAHEVADDEDILPPVVAKPRRQRASENGIVVEGLDQALVRLARCCTPVPGDPVVGFVTRGRGVSAHRADCPNIESLKQDQGRMIPVSWATGTAGAYSVAIVVEALDRRLLLRDVTTTLSDLGVNIIEAQTHSDRRRHVATLRFTVELPDAAHLDHTLSALRRIDGVFDATRFVPGRSLN
jgi:GTP diphosphokinase / guanosine-3',5'-bis(diphosphate) 3'-diphosphatase